MAGTGILPAFAENEKPADAHVDSLLRQTVFAVDLLGAVGEGTSCGEDGEYHVAGEAWEVVGVAFEDIADVVGSYEADVERTKCVSVSLVDELVLLRGEGSVKKNCAAVHPLLLLVLIIPEWEITYDHVCDCNRCWNHTAMQI